MDKKHKGPSWGECMRTSLRNTSKYTMIKLVPEHFSSAEASTSPANLGAALRCSMMVSHGRVSPREHCDRKAISTASHRDLPSTPSLPETLAKEDTGTI